MSNGKVVRIAVNTPCGVFRVWTKRYGANPRARLLLLHGGPGLTHEYFKILEQPFAAAGIEYFLYDQLGSAHSDQPDAPELWHLPRFVDEVEQVRQALQLERDNFILLGHSWGAMLAIEYALKHPHALKGLVLSNAMASIPAYNDYLAQTLAPAIDAEARAEIERLEAAAAYDDPRYGELMTEHFYVRHVLRMPYEQWPDAVSRSFEKTNPRVSVPLLGRSDLKVTGLLADWDRQRELEKIDVPTLVIGARYDTMDPAHLESMSKQLPRGRYLFCPQGSHFAMYDDRDVYRDGVVAFLRDIERRSAT